MSKLRAFALTCVLSLAVVASSASAPSASAAPPNGAGSPQAVALQRALTAATPESVQRAAHSNPASTRQGAVLTHAYDRATIQVPARAAEGISVANGDQRIRVTLPRAEAAAPAETVAHGIVSFDNKDGSTTVPVVLQDGSVQINTVIASADAPTRYKYGLDLPQGASVTEVDGIVLLHDQNGSFLGGLAPAWAKDADGRQVPTRYELQGSSVTQVVDHDASFTYPVVADPWLGVNLFSYVSSTVRAPYLGQPVYTMELSTWGQLIYRGSAALGLAGVPMGAGMPIAYIGYQIMTNEGWAEVKSRQPGANTVSVQQQYVCHVRYGYPVLGSGWRWDLERARPPKYDWTRTNVFAHRCNW